MATRSMIGIEEAGGVRGRYVHFDGYPSDVGQEFAAFFKENGLAGVASLLDKHPAGFSSFDAATPNCYCHDRGEFSHDEHTDWMDLNDALDAGCEFVYLASGDKVRVLGAKQGDWVVLGEFDVSSPNLEEAVAGLG